MSKAPLMQFTSYLNLRTRQRPTCVVAMLLALVACQPLTAAPPQTTVPSAAQPNKSDTLDTRPIALVYLPDWVDTTPDMLPLDDLTHICHAFATATPEGQLLTGDHIPNTPLIKEAHKHGVKMLLSVGGADSDVYLAPIAQDPAKLDRFIGELITFVKTHHYDGIDLDWEFPLTQESAQGLAVMVQRLKLEIEQLEQQTGKDYLLTRAVGGGWAYTHVPTELFRDNFDFLNVMGYDCAGPWEETAAHHAPLTASTQGAAKNVETVQSILNHWKDERGLPASQLVLGMPAYGRGFKGVNMFDPVEKNSPAHAEYSYAQIAEKQAAGWTLTRLDNGAPWLIAPDQSEIIGFDDPQSIAQKTQWAMSQGLAGVFFWEATQDRMADNSHPLIQAAVKNLPLQNTPQPQ